MNPINHKTVTTETTGPKTLAELFRRWREEDPQEQRETLEYLMRVLDEDRLSKRKLFE
jgi:hypothetical protein